MGKKKFFKTTEERLPAHEYTNSDLSPINLLTSETKMQFYFVRSVIYQLKASSISKEHENILVSLMGIRKCEYIIMTSQQNM